MKISWQFIFSPPSWKKKKKRKKFGTWYLIVRRTTCSPSDNWKRGREGIPVCLPEAPPADTRPAVPPHLRHFELNPTPTLHRNQRLSRRNRTAADKELSLGNPLRRWFLSSLCFPREATTSSSETVSPPLQLTFVYEFLFLRPNFAYSMSADEKWWFKWIQR